MYAKNSEVQKLVGQVADKHPYFYKIFNLIIFQHNSSILGKIP